MKSYRKELWFNLPGRRGFININAAGRGCAARKQIFCGEFDGGRRKRVLVKIIGE